MKGHDTPAAAAEPVAHPLAHRLIERLGPRAGCVLLLGIGSGRNVPALLDAGMHVAVVEDDARRAAAARRRFADEPRVSITHAPYSVPFTPAGTYVAALSTHALLHGTLGDIAAAVGAIRLLLPANAPFFTTLGSTADPRYGSGRHIEGATYAPVTGSEAGVPHTYFDAPGIHRLFADFTMLDVTQGSAAANAGRWAHDAGEAATLVHWTVRALRR